MVASAGIIIIGDEILSGRTKDSNINWIACELDNLGIRLKEARIIPDDPVTIITTITPARFPNKSEYSKLLSGIKLWNNSRKIDIIIKYIDKYWVFFEFL